ncbi:MAG: phospho-sugar mutase, partial [Lachnospiraceae bacterium]|nr:phospho-sugar mutase [Lachnospiraceae bacterium]
LGIYSLDSKSGEYMEFTGNMSGALLCEYMLSQLEEKGELKDNSAVTTTVVITKLIRDICDRYGVYCDYNNLIGFKYIAAKIREYETTNSYSYVFGLEESYGCLPGTYARDKDAVGTVMLLCEAAAYYRDKGMTLWDKMMSLFEEYGYYRENIETMTFEGKEGSEKIKSMIQQLRDNPISELIDYKVEKVTDYLPKANMILYELSDDAWFLVRPSGTEPKIKFYLGVKGNSLENSMDRINNLGSAVKALFS